MKFELLIRNATVIDGTRAPRFEADIAVKDGKIVSIGSLINSKADVEIDASGKIAAPGFIDAHTHDDRLMLSAPDMAPKVSQGVTTVVAGNCGCSLAPAPKGMRLPVTPPLDLLDDAGGWFRFATFRDYVEELAAHPPATNCALLGGDAAAHRGAHEKPADRARLLSVLRLVDHSFGGPCRSGDQDSRHLVEAPSRSRRHGPRGDPARLQAQHRAAPAGGRHLFLDERGGRAAHP